MITVIMLLIGIAVFCGGMYYFIKEKNDPESKRIYGIAALVGIIITAAALLILILN